MNKMLASWKHDTLLRHNFPHLNENSLRYAWTGDVKKRGFTILAAEPLVSFIKGIRRIGLLFWQT